MEAAELGVLLRRAVALMAEEAEAAQTEPEEAAKRFLENRARA